MDAALGTPEHGRLEDQPLPSLLATLFDAQAYGMLTIESDNLTTWIYFDEGMPAGVDNPNAGVYLGMILQELGLITHDDFNESLMQMAKTGKLQGQVLIDMGKISEEQLEQALQLQMVRKVAGLLALREGVFKFARDEAPPARVIPFPVHPYQVIYYGIKSQYNDTELDKQLDPLMNRAWRLSECFADCESKIQLTPDDRNDVGMLEKLRMPDQFFRSARSGPARARMLLLCLHHCGLLAEGDPDQASSEVPVRPRPEPSQKRARGQPVERPAKSEAARSKKTRGKPHEQDRFLRLLRHKYDQARSGDVFALLEIQRDSTSVKLEESYLRLAKTFHPDRAARMSDEKTREQMEFVFSRINEAYQSLVKTLNTQKEAGGSAPDSATNVEAARVAAKKAEVYQRKKQWSQAIESMQLAHRFDPDNPDYQTEVLWLSYLACEDDKPARLELVRDRLIRLAAKYPNCFLVARRLATACQLSGDEAGYERYLQRAANIDPDDIEVIRELRLHTTRKKKREEDKRFLGIKFKK